MKETTMRCRRIRFNKWRATTTDERDWAIRFLEWNLGKKYALQFSMVGPTGWYVGLA